MTDFIQLFQGTPLFVVLTIFVVVSIFAIWMYARKLNLDAITEITETQSSQIINLQKLVESLTEELSDARAEIREISAQNKDLRIHILKLERILLENNMTPPSIVT